MKNDGVALGSPLGLILANLFMVKLENTLVPWLHQHVKKSWHYVDDTFAYVKNESIDYVLTTLNSFHPNISFGNERENNNHLPFLDIWFIRNRKHLDTAAELKDTNHELYLHCDALTRINLNRRTWQSLTEKLTI